jgi:hypothetical protein
MNKYKLKKALNYSDAFALTAMDNEYKQARLKAYSQKPYLVKNGLHHFEK